LLFMKLPRGASVRLEPELLVWQGRESTRAPASEMCRMADAKCRGTCLESDFDDQIQDARLQKLEGGIGRRAASRQHELGSSKVRSQVPRTRIGESWLGQDLKSAGRLREADCGGRVRYALGGAARKFPYASDRKPSVGDRYLGWLTWVLLGYALLGRGFAYLGVGPIYIGEITLFFGLVIWSLNRFSFEVLRLLPACFLAAFMFWNLTRSLPYLSEYGIATLRDAASWGYGFFAFIVATLLIARPERLRLLLDRFRKFVVIFAVVAPVAWLLELLYSDAIPRLPGSPGGIVDVKAGDLLVHLTGAAAFLISGLAGASSLLSLFLAVMLCVNFPLMAFWNRGGMLAFLLAVALASLLSPFKAKALYMLAVFALAFFVLFATDAKIQLSGLSSDDVELSAEQLVMNLQSVVSANSANAGRLESTKQWRLEWWGKIVSYTFRGDYFWTGKGYGINLADDDDFHPKRIEDDTPLRSPHSIHMMFLARSGVPGLAFWLLVQATWALGMLIGHLRSRDRGDRRWAGLFLFLLAYWVAFMINASFDVFVEGPMGGIWLWTVYGVGLGAMWIYRRYPEVLWEPSSRSQKLGT
jgi:hypothetical protein